MNIKYNVSIPIRRSTSNENLSIINGFLASNKKSMSIEYDEGQDEKARAMVRFVKSRPELNLCATQRKNTVFVWREK